MAQLRGGGQLQQGNQFTEAMSAAGTLVNDALKLGVMRKQVETERMQILGDRYYRLLEKDWSTQAGGFQVWITGAPGDEASKAQASKNQENMKYYLTEFLGVKGGRSNQIVEGLMTGVLSIEDQRSFISAINAMNPREKDSAVGTMVDAAIEEGTIAAAARTEAQGAQVTLEGEPPEAAPAKPTGADTQATIPPGEAFIRKERAPEEEAFTGTRGEAPGGAVGAFKGATAAIPPAILGPIVGPIAGAALGRFIGRHATGEEFEIGTLTEMSPKRFLLTVGEETRPGDFGRITDAWAEKSGQDLSRRQRNLVKEVIIASNPTLVNEAGFSRMLRQARAMKQPFTIELPVISGWVMESLIVDWESERKGRLVMRWLGELYNMQEKRGRVSK